MIAMDEFAYLIQRFIDRLEKIEGRSYHTVRAYKSTLKEFYRWMVENGYSLEDVSEEVIEEFLFLKTGVMTPDFINNGRSHVLTISSRIWTISWLTAGPACFRCSLVTP